MAPQDIEEINATVDVPTVTRVIYEYCVLRYVADIEREEFVNVGLLMMSKRYRWLRAEIFIDEDRICRCFPRANVSLLRNQLAAFTRDDVPEKGIPVEERYRWLAAVKSAVIQTSPSHPGILLIDSDTSIDVIKTALEGKFSHLFQKLVK